MRLSGGARHGAKSNKIGANAYVFPPGFSPILREALNHFARRSTRRNKQTNRHEN
jgi:hypothetical protein